MVFTIILAQIPILKKNDTFQAIAHLDKYWFLYIDLVYLT